jgi:hypothetical protein
MRAVLVFTLLLATPAMAESVCHIDSDGNVLCSDGSWGRRVNGETFIDPGSPPDADGNLICN